MKRSAYVALLLTPIITRLNRLEAYGSNEATLVRLAKKVERLERLAVEVDEIPKQGKNPATQAMRVKVQKLQQEHDAIKLRVDALEVAIADALDVLDTFDESEDQTFHGDLYKQVELETWHNRGRRLGVTQEGES